MVDRGHHDTLLGTFSHKAVKSPVHDLVRVLHPRSRNCATPWLVRYRPRSRVETDWRWLEARAWPAIADRACCRICRASRGSATTRQADCVLTAGAATPLRLIDCARSMRPARCSAPSARRRGSLGELDEESAGPTLGRHPRLQHFGSAPHQIRCWARPFLGFTRSKGCGEIFKESGGKVVKNVTGYDRGKPDGRLLRNLGQALEEAAGLEPCPPGSKVATASSSPGSNPPLRRIPADGGGAGARRMKFRAPPTCRRGPGCCRLPEAIAGCIGSARSREAGALGRLSPGQPDPRARRGRRTAETSACSSRLRSGERIGEVPPLAGLANCAVWRSRSRWRVVLNYSPRRSRPSSIWCGSSIGAAG